jgi:MFS transporter, putative metabolite transport protein
MARCRWPRGPAVASRYEASISTFLLPVAVQHVGIHAALGVCVAILVFGGVFCHLFALETGSENRSDMISGHGGHSRSTANRTRTCRRRHIATGGPKRLTRRWASAWV